MANPRKQLRANFKALLLGQTAAGNNVFTSRTKPLKQSELPALRIWANEEIGQRSTLKTLLPMDRNIEVVVEICAQETENLDDVLDDLIEEVETLVDGAAKTVFLGGHAEGIQVDTELADRSMEPTGQARMTITVVCNA